MGITHFMTENDTGFSGVLKQRFSDFIVHEVRCTLSSFMAGLMKPSPAAVASMPCGLLGGVCTGINRPTAPSVVVTVSFCSAGYCAAVKRVPAPSSRFRLVSFCSYPHPTLATNDWLTASAASCAVRVSKVAPGGGVCKGTDFPGLLGPIEHVRQPGPRDPHPPAAGQPDSKPEPAADDAAAATAAAASAPATEEGAASEHAQDKGGDERDSKDGSPEGGVGDKDEDAKRERLEKEEKAKKEEEDEETRRLIKAGAEALFGVLGEEVAAKVRRRSRKAGTREGQNDRSHKKERGAFLSSWPSWVLSVVPAGGAKLVTLPIPASGVVFLAA